MKGVAGFNRRRVQQEKNVAKTNDRVILVVEKTEIPCSRSLLSQHSQYFKAMFSHFMREHTASHVPIHEFSPEVLTFIIHFMKDPCAKVTMDTVFETTRAAVMFQIPQLIRKCTEYLMSRIKPENCLRLMHLAEICGLQPLYNKAKKYSLWFYTKVIWSDDYINLPLNAVIDYLKHDMLNILSEGDIYEGIKFWVTTDHSKMDERIQHLPELITCLRSNNISKKGVQDIYEDSIMVLCPPAQEKIMQLAKVEMKVRPAVPYSPVVLGGNEIQDSHSSDEDDWYPGSHREQRNNMVYRWDNDYWDYLTQVNAVTLGPGIADGCKACVLGKDLYVGGGAEEYGQSRWDLNLWKYDSFENCWEICSKLPGPRRHHSMCALDDTIYLIGGFGRHRIMLQSVVSFHTKSGSWSDVPPLPKAEFSAAAVACCDKIYLIKNDVQCYNPDVGQWSTINMPLPFEYGFFSAACSEPFIYLTAKNSKKLIEVDTKTETYKEVGAFRRTHGPCCVVGASVYSVGGDGTDEVETFDIVTGTVEFESMMPVTLRDHQVLALPCYPQFHISI